MNFRRAVFLLSMFVFVQATAQVTAIEGVVTDAETRQGIPFAHVFISNTTAVTVTDQNGKFRFMGLADGRGQLVVSYVGYENFSMQLDPGRRNAKLDIRLRATKETLESVVTVASTEDKEWQRNLKTFKRDFLGRTSNARACELANPWVLEFDRRGNAFLASVTAPLEILNEALGYELTFYLNTFQSASTEYSIVGPVRFRELDDPSRLEEWEQKRLAAYQGSIKHFFHELWKSRHLENDFKIYRSINALEEEQRTGRFETDLGTSLKAVKREDLVRDDPKDGLIFFSLRPVEIHYTAARDFEPVYQDVLHQVSWIQASGGMVRFDSAGNILNPQDVVVSGYWNRLRVGDLLPLDYVAGKSLRQSKEPEKLMITTDKGMYADGSSVWYSVYTSGRSLTVNVDLLDGRGKVIASRVDPVEKGMAKGFFAVPDTEGGFFLRASSPKSLAEGGAFIKPLTKQPGDSVLACDNPAADFDILNWQLDSLAGKEMLELSLRDMDGDTISGEFTVSVAPAATDCDCLHGYWTNFAPPESNQMPTDGVPAGRVVNKKGEPLLGKVLFLTRDLSLSLERNVGSDGRFRLDDVIHYDTTAWIAQFHDRKNKRVEDFQIQWDTPSGGEAPNMELDLPRCRFEQLAMEGAVSRRATKVRAEDAYVLSDSTRLLSEVTVRGRKISRDAKPNTTFRSYGSPQYVVKGEEMANAPAGVNVLNALATRVPGLIVSEVGTAWTGETIRIQIRGQSSMFNGGSDRPMIIIDGLPFQELDQAYNLLQTIPLTDIDRVEVRTALSPAMGSLGTEGVIAVYTKRTDRPVGTAFKPSPFVKPVSIRGYSAPPHFQPDSLSLSTILWDPGVEFGWRPVMIDASALPDIVEVSISGTDPTGVFFNVRRRLDLRVRRPD